MSIYLVDNFELGVSKPIDNRFVVGPGFFYPNRDSINNKYVGLRVWDTTLSQSFVWNGTNWLSESSGGGVGTVGPGTVNRISRFINSSTIGDSIISQLNSRIGINNNTPAYELDVDGRIYSSTGFIGNGSQITSINASNISSGNISLARLSNGGVGNVLVGSTGPASWIPFSSLISNMFYNAGDGLVLVGNTFSVITDSSLISGTSGVSIRYGISNDSSLSTTINGVVLNRITLANNLQGQGLTSSSGIININLSSNSGLTFSTVGGGGQLKLSFDNNTLDIVNGELTVINSIDGKSIINLVQNDEQTDTIITTSDTWEILNIIGDLPISVGVNFLATAVSPGTTYGITFSIEDEVGNTISGFFITLDGPVYIEGIENQTFFTSLPEGNYTITVVASGYLDNISTYYLDSDITLIRIMELSTELE